MGVNNCAGQWNGSAGIPRKEGNSIANRGEFHRTERQEIIVVVQNFKPSCGEFGGLREEEGSGGGSCAWNGMCAGRESGNFGMGKEGEDGPGKKLLLGNSKGQRRLKKVKESWEVVGISIRMGIVG